MKNNGKHHLKYWLVLSNAEVFIQDPPKVYTAIIWDLPTVHNFCPGIGDWNLATIYNFCTE
jgi:hypothetical protein